MHEPLVYHAWKVLPLVCDHVVPFYHIQGSTVKPAQGIDVLAVVAGYSCQSASTCTHTLNCDPLLPLHVKPKTYLAKQPLLTFQL